MTRSAFAHAVLRILVGGIYVMHGYPKLFGGIDATAGFLGQLGFPIPFVLAWFVALLETVGGLLLVFGLLVTPLALLFIVEMSLGIALVHLPNGFYVIGRGQGGVEFNLLLIAALLVLLLAGPGAWAIGGPKKAEPGDAA